MSHKNMRLLVLGDENVGKSSLIHTIYSEVSSNVQKTLKKVILPPEMCLYSKQVFTQLVDTSVDMEITTELRASDLVLLVYDVSDPQTIGRIESDWLPKINSINPKIPIILVGNKMDKKQLQIQSEQEYTKIKDILKKVARKYKNVQMGIQCSAFYDRNVKSVLNCAQRAVLYPLAPLYNLQERKITPAFRKALIRIFRILDDDFDGKLYDSQLNALQERVFQAELNIEDIKAIKQIILRQLQVQQHDYIQLKGFIALQKKVIEMLKIQICWSILRHFNYDNKLRISIDINNYIVDYNCGQSVQLSSEAINFLLKSYHAAKRMSILQLEQSKNKSQQEKEYQKGVLQKIFQPCPQIEFQEFSDLKDMDQQSFITTWNLYAFLNYKKCYKDLLYIGYQRSVQQAFNRRKNKRSYSDFQKLRENKVFSILIIDNDSYQGYLQPLFCEAKEIHVVQQNKNFTYQRTSLLFKNNSVSKTFLLFKIKKQNLHSFFNESPQSSTNFSKCIDLILQFDQNIKSSPNTQELISDFILYRRISENQAENILHVSNPPKLNLNLFPIRYQQGAYSVLFSQIILKAIQNIQGGLTKSKIKEMRQQKNKKNFIIISTLSIVVALAVVGTIAFKKLR